VQTKQPRRLKPKKTAKRLPVKGIAGVIVIDVEKDTKTVNAHLRASLGDLLGILTRVGGFMKPEDQALLRKARHVHAGGV
jgi:hypothetical protein